MILLLDNVDSFVHNLARHFARLSRETRVVRTTDVSIADVADWRPHAMVFSPGPGAPHDRCPAVGLIREFWGKIPMLGVCLGHQQIVHAAGGTIGRSPCPMHGQSAEIRHDESHEFLGLTNPLTAARYHSLIAALPIPDQLHVSAHAEDGQVMAVRSTEYPVFGWQFHPESILTSQGYSLLAGFLRESGLGESVNELPEAELTQPESRAARASPIERSHPITF